MVRISVVLAAASIPLALAAPAPAQEDIRPDADSPAGVEYQPPLDRAREEASGGGESDRGSSSGGAPLFGEGIERRARGGDAGGRDRSTGAATSPGDASGNGSAGGGGSGDDAGGQGGEEAADVKRASLSDPGGSGGDGGDFRTGLIIGVVLGVGAALGLLLRRGLRDTGG